MFNKTNVIAILTGLVLLAGCAGKGGQPATEAKPAGDDQPPESVPLDIKSHKLTVELDPVNHLLKGKDLMTIKLPEASAITPSYFALHPQLTLKSLAFANGSSFQFKQYASANDYTIYTFNFPVDMISSNDTLGLECIYEGKIYDQVQGEQSLGFIRGGLTSGIIGQQGVYLHHGTAWYPRTTLSPMLRFEVTTITPKGWEVVGQDELKERVEIGEQKDKTRTTWTSQVPFDSYSLVAGQYVVTEEKHQGVRIATYFSAESQQFAQMHIDATKEFITLFSQMLIPYPFKSFSIVENFFTTGYGMPSYTLLGKDVIMSGRHANEGGVGHEIMHCWWGNYVNVDESDGNWCEGLTTYCSNYYYLELKKTKQDTINYRRNTAVKFSAYINEQNDYPARQFRSKEEEQDSEIGYGKTSMVFHMMRRQIGDEAFLQGLRMVIQEHGAGKASWRDFQSAFEKSAGKKPGDFSWFFTQWLERTGAPVISLEDVSTNTTPDGSHQVSFVIKQNTAEPFRLSVPLILTADSGQLAHTIEMSGASQRVTLPAPKGATKLVSLALDPEYDIFRRLNRREQSPCFGMTLSDQNLLIIYPSGGAPEERAFYQKIAERVASTRQAMVKADKDTTESDMEQNSLLLLGDLKINGVTAKLPAMLSAASSKLELKEGSFGILGASYQEPKYAVLVSERNPHNPDKYITLFMGLSKEAVERPARTMFFYRWDQFVIFANGRMAQKGDFAPPYNTLEYRFQSDGQSASPIDGNTIKKHAEYLASPALEGRAPGTKGDKLAAEYIANEFKKYGLKPPANNNSYLDEFSIFIQQLDKDIQLKIDGKALALGKDFLPYNFSFSKYRTNILYSGLIDGNIISAGYGITAPEYKYDDYQGKDVKDKVVLIKAGLPENTAVTDTKYSSALSKATNAKNRGAKAVLISGNMPGSTEMAWEEFPPQDIQKRAASEETKVRNVSLRSLVMSAQSRLMNIEGYGETPVFWVSLPPDTLKDDSKVEIAKWQPTNGPEITTSKTHNVIGILEGSDPALKNEILVIGAHYDHLGLGTDGKCFSGANDNASGTAGLLAIAETMSKQRLKRSIAFIAFGGEECGLWGSKFTAGVIQIIEKRQPVTSRALKDYKTAAMLNMDMIGRGNLGEFYVMGKAFNPELFEVVSKANLTLNLSLKTNIDFLFKYGSDHASFHQAKVPALNFTSGPFEGEHTVEDTADKLMPDKMSQIATLVYLSASEIANSDIKFPEPKDIEVPMPRGGGGHHPGRPPMTTPK